jgi:hypothetical protein
MATGASRSKKAVGAKKKTAAKPKKRPADVNQLAHFLGKQSTQAEEHGGDINREELSRVMSVLGKKGGKLGGKARAEKLTPERRTEIALKAAKKRWESRPENSTGGSA